jgi:hypothetical protein
MIRVRFQRDYLGLLTNGQFYPAGAVAEFSPPVAQALAAKLVVVVVPVEVPPAAPRVGLPEAATHPAVSGKPARKRSSKTTRKLLQ